MKTEFQSPISRPLLAKGPIRSLAAKSDVRANHLLWLDRNENIDPEYNDFVKELISDLPASILSAYPDCFSLYQKLAEYLQVNIDQLIIAPGSDGVIRSIYETFVSPGDTVIYPEPTFLMYSLYVQIYGAQGIVLNYTPSENGPVLLRDTLLNSIEKEKPRLVCLPNPGSPTGTVFSSVDLREIIEAAGRVGAVILIDEAYHPFYSETVLPWINLYPHLVVSRTFSKAWGLAGIRLGYGAACQSLMRELHKVRARYEVGALSAAVAERILNYPDVMRASVQRTNDGKAYFLNEMKKLGFRTLKTEGNFLHVAFDEQASAVHAALANSVLYQKDFKHPALSGYSRFTSTTRELFAPLVSKISLAMQDPLNHKNKQGVVNECC